MNEDNIINVNPETGEVEEPTTMEKIKGFVGNHCGLFLGIIGVIIGSIATIVTIKNEVEEEEVEEDAGEE